MTPEQNNNQSLQNPTTNTPKLRPKTIRAMKLVDAGLSEREALQATNYKNSISREAISKFRVKYRKYSLIAPPVVKLAHNQVKRILAAEEREVARQKITSDGQVVDYTEVIVPTDSNILAAASMVYERFEPVHAPDGGEPGGVTYLDLSQYRVQVNVSTGDHTGNKPNV